MTLDVRLTVRAHDGALAHTTYGGRWVTPPPLREALADPAERLRIDPARYYFRTTPVFEPGAETYAWLNGIVCVGSGCLVQDGIAYKVSQVLRPSAAPFIPCRRAAAAPPPRGATPTG
ncbi:DUF3237 domain-containing protein [Streptomyces sp. 24-1644]|uniref:DUF3237 domain-containing protein n=1 Tax=Streptomyces sp. 24-1644 TaxID=3457315 RepID=UPI003FA7CABD